MLTVTEVRRRKGKEGRNEETSDDANPSSTPLSLTLSPRACIVPFSLHAAPFLVCMSCACRVQSDSAMSLPVVGVHVMCVSCVQSDFAISSNQMTHEVALIEAKYDAMGNPHPGGTGLMIPRLDCEGMSFDLICEMSSLLDDPSTGL